MNRRLFQEDAPSISKADRLAASSLQDEEEEDADEAYETVYSLEDDLPPVDLDDLPSEGVTEDLRQLETEEYPYVAQRGGLSHESDEEKPMEQLSRGRWSNQEDVYSNSMDVNEEDLESFTEALDGEIDSALPS